MEQPPKNLLRNLSAIDCPVRLVSQLVTVTGYISAILGAPPVTIDWESDGIGWDIDGWPADTDYLVFIDWQKPGELRVRFGEPGRDDEPLPADVEAKRKAVAAFCKRVSLLPATS